MALMKLFGMGRRGRGTGCLPRVGRWLKSRSWLCILAWVSAWPERQRDRPELRRAQNSSEEQAGSSSSELVPLQGIRSPKVLNLLNQE
jgi:hypothetical protein